MPVEVAVTLREKNQLTLPERVAERLGVEPGDRLLITAGDEEPPLARLRPLRRSYAGVATGVYGADREEQLGYLDVERASWDETGPGTASDGTRFLTFEESRRLHPGVTREEYERDAKWRWPKCDVCGRLIARMSDHKKLHSSGLIDRTGRRTDPEQKRQSRSRVAKWRAAMARRSKAS